MSHDCPPHIAWSAFGVTKIPKQFASTLQDGGSNISFLRNTYMSGPELVSGASNSMDRDLSSLQSFYPRADRGSSSTTNAMSLAPMTNRYQYGMVNSLYENARQKMDDSCSLDRGGSECRRWSSVKSNMDHQLSMGKTKLFGEDLIPVPQAYQRNF